MDEVDLDMTGLVPAETQERWKNKIMNSRHTLPQKLAEAQERAQNAMLFVAQERKKAGLPAFQQRPDLPEAALQAKGLA